VPLVISNNFALAQTPALDTNNPSNQCEKRTCCPVAWFDDRAFRDDGAIRALIPRPRLRHELLAPSSSAKVNAVFGG
jgi:hypothetical protein